MYQQVIEAVAVFASHGNSGGSAPWEINLVQKLCDWNIISPLRFTDEEWMQISSDGTCQNRRKGNVFKEPDGSIHYNGAFSKRATDRYSFDTKETIYIDCVEVEISPDNWIMAVNKDNTDLLILSCNYSIQWKECSCLKAIVFENGGFVGNLGLVKKTMEEIY